MTVRRKPEPLSLWSLRTTLELTQQELASLLGVSTVSVNRWERGHTQGDLARVLTNLLQGAIVLHPPERIVKRLRAGDGSMLHAVRTLAELERTRKP